MSNESTTSRARSGPLDDEIDLHRLFALLIDAKWLILGTTVLALLLGALYAALATPIYKADALLQVEKKQAGLPGFEELNEALGQESSAAAEIAILTSRMSWGTWSSNCTPISWWHRTAHLYSALSTPRTRRRRARRDRYSPATAIAKPW